MAAKTIASAKSAKGLKLTTNEKAAYNKAFAAAATKTRKKIALSSASQGLRKYRLQAAYKTVKKASNAKHNAQAAAVAAYASRMSWSQSRLAHQNSALQARIEQDMYKHAELAGRLQYVQAGEKAYAHQAVMRTLDTVQATSIESKVFRKAHKAAKKASKSTLSKSKISNAAAKAIVKSGTAAGLAAAAKAAPSRGCVPLRGELAAAKRLREIEQPRCNWYGDEVSPNCIIFAVANSLLMAKGIPASAKDLQELTDACGDKPTIEQVLWQAYLTGWPNHRLVRLHDYRPAARSGWDKPGLVIGYKTEYGDHCSLSLEESVVVSWGSTVTRTTPVDEAWELTWEKIH